MAKNLKQLLLRYYAYQEDLKKFNLEVEELQNNPVIYANEQDVDYLQQVLKYKTKVQNKYYELKTVSDTILSYNNELVELLTTIGVPPNHRIIVNDYDHIAHFWHDDDGYVDYELVK